MICINKGLLYTPLVFLYLADGAVVDLATTAATRLSVPPAACSAAAATPNERCTCRNNALRS